MDALFGFDDPATGRRVRERLIELGLPERDVTLHAPNPNPDARLVDAADELVTGGLVRSFQRLLEGLFDGESVARDTSAYGETLQRGGAVLHVRAATQRQVVDVDAAVTTIGCSRRTGWSGAAG